MATEHAHAHGTAAGHTGPHHDAKFYVRIWAILLVLLVISILGPEVSRHLPGGHNVQFGFTMFTAFGIAVVKAYLVIRNFMHLTVEKKWVTYMLVTMLLFAFIFVGATMPDVMKHDGQRWENVAAKQSVELGLKDSGEGHGGHRGSSGENAPTGTEFKDQAEHQDKAH
jgi:caa(3)-type oxidase subunit IV